MVILVFLVFDNVIVQVLLYLQTMSSTFLQNRDYVNPLLRNGKLTVETMEVKKSDFYVLTNLT